MTESSEMERLINPRGLDDILMRYGKEDTAMSDDTREREVEWLLLGLGGEELVKLTRGNVETLGVSSLSESAMAQYGSLEGLREKVQERRDLLNLADDFGQPRELVEAELKRRELAEAGMEL